MLGTQVTPWGLRGWAISRNCKSQLNRTRASGMRVQVTLPGQPSRPVRRAGGVGGIQDAWWGR